jgi:hypothetical protein
MTAHVAEANDYRLAADGAVEVAAYDEAPALEREAFALIEALWAMPLTCDHEQWKRVHAAAWRRWSRRLMKKWEANDVLRTAGPRRKHNHD